MYSSIMKTKTQPGDWLVIPGAGGGLGHMYVQLCEYLSSFWANNVLFRGVQIAVKKGLKVIAIDR